MHTVPEGADVPDGMSPPSRSRAPALNQGLLVLEYLADHGQAKVIQLVHTLGIPRSSLYNIVSTLAAHGFVSVERGTLRLGVRLLHLAGGVVSTLDLRRIARPVMERMVAATEETANVGVWSGAEVVYIEIVHTPLPVKLSAEVGRTCPSHCTALGKALLASVAPDHYARLVRGMSWERHTACTIRGPADLAAACALVRERGWALDDEEFERGVRCLAVPLRDHTGSVKAALSLSGPTHRLPDARMPELVAALREAQAEIEAALGGPGRAEVPKAGALA